MQSDTVYRSKTLQFKRMKHDTSGSINDDVGVESSFYASQKKKNEIGSDSRPIA